jgi:hypothetical protein
MKSLNYIVVLSILAALILAMVAIVPAIADKPDHRINILEDEWYSYMCDDEIPILTHQEGKCVQNYFYDRYGEDRADTYHCGGTTLTYTYNDHTLTLYASENYHWDWITWYDAIVEIKGASYIGTLPGHGVVKGTLGKQVWLETCHEEGEDWVCDYELLDISGMVFNDQEAVCDYLLNGK